MQFGFVQNPINKEHTAMYLHSWTFHIKLPPLPAGPDIHQVTHRTCKFTAGFTTQGTWTKAETHFTSLCPMFASNYNRKRSVMNTKDSLVKGNVLL